MKLFPAIGVVLTCALFNTGCQSYLPDDSGSQEEETPILRAGYNLDIKVVVTGKKEIDEPGKRIADDGTLSLPLLGQIRVTGLTLNQLAADLTTKYKEYLVEPLVVVDFSKDVGPDAISPWGYVRVMGKVVKPGQVGIPPTRDLTVSRAIQLAGGLSTSANDSAIRVTRKKRGGKAETYQINLRSVGTEGKIEQDLKLKSGDVVFIPEKIL